MRRYRTPLNGDHALVSVDPGKRKCGVAVWRNGRLVAAAHVPTGNVADWLEIHTEPNEPRAWVVEVPHERGTDDLARRRGVTAVARAVERLREVASARAAAGFTWMGVRPSAWKGNVPKKVHHSRAVAALVACEFGNGGRRLSPRSGGYQPDTADAIALGLWALGRTERGGAVTTNADVNANPDNEEDHYAGTALSRRCPGSA